MTATATDRAGNLANVSITVTRTKATQAHVRILSGNNQSGVVNGMLAEPLRVGGARRRWLSHPVQDRCVRGAAE